jgi:acetyltransferase-like isoleucine patch superfamily enzyme
MAAAYIHPSALVESDAVGPGTRIWAFTHVLPGAVIGRDCNIGDHCFVEGGARLGDGVVVKNGNMIWEGVEIGDAAFIGPHVFFTNDLFPRSKRLPEAAARAAKKENWLVRTRVQHGASLGAGAVILGGVSIGEYSLVAAGAVVTKDVPAHALVMGAPARVRGWVCRCGLRLKWRGQRGACHACGLRYRRGSRGVELSAAGRGR